MATKSTALLQLHIATLLFGLSAVVADASGLSASVVTFGRTLFAALVLAVLLVSVRVASAERRTVTTLPSPRVLFAACASGILLSLHWYCFFRSIEMATVAIGLICFSTCAVFTALMEPLVFNERWHWLDGLAALVVVAGIIVLAGLDISETSQHGAIAWGLLGALLFSTLQLSNRHLAAAINPVTLSALQVTIACALFAPIALPALTNLNAVNWLQLAFLGVVCTALAHTLFIASLKQLNASLASTVAAGLEPVYGIVLAAVLLLQWPGTPVWVGGTLVLSAVLFVSLRSYLASR